MIDISSKQKSKITIQCYSVPEYGHAIPLLRIIRIVQSANPSFDITYFSSAFSVEKIKSQFPEIKMVGIEDGLTAQNYKQTFKKMGLKTFTQVIPALHNKHFQSKMNKPDLMIFDIYSVEAYKYVRRNKIKFIVNCPYSYKTVQLRINFPTFQRSFGIGGFTVMYPHPLNPPAIMGIHLICNSIRYNCILLINTAIGLQHPNVFPTHHIATGILANQAANPSLVSNELKEWMENWKKKGKSKFVYLSFGTVLDLSQNFILKLQNSINIAQYPTIWSLKNDLNGKVSSDYIYHKAWLPQQSILSLPQVRAYISHCGWGSTTEAVATQTPLICIPGFGDQIDNAKLAHEKGIGLKIYQPRIPIPPKLFDPDIEVQTIVQAITKIIDDESYLNNITRINAICKTHRTEQIINEVITSTLQFGYDHLIDKNFQKVTQRNTFTSVKLFGVILLFVLIWIYRKEIQKLFG